MAATHQVFNQPLPLTDTDLFEVQRPLQAALALHAPGLDLNPLRELGRLAGSADMQQHARLANTHLPQLRTHSRVGHRIVAVIALQQHGVERGHRSRGIGVVAHPLLLLGPTL